LKLKSINIILIKGLNYSEKEFQQKHKFNSFLMFLGFFIQQREIKWENKDDKNIFFKINLRLIFGTEGSVSSLN
jgi:hypothetical protein